MAKHSRRKFENELDCLFKIRTHSLVSHYWPTKGATPKLTPSKIRNSIKNLQAIAEKELLSSRYGKELLAAYDNKKSWHTKRGKGWDRQTKKRTFKLWYDKNITTKNCVYVFWNNKRCLYIGRTLNGKGRPIAHFEKHWFNRATRIDIYGFERKRDVPRFECLLTHKCHPKHSKIRPSQKRYYSKCPICEGDKLIRNQVKYIFRMR